jgi:superfamily I DNA/RNA helicase
VWDVFERYAEWLEDEEAEDYDNPAGLILRSLMETQGELPESLRYDHVLVDEVQDFDRSWLVAAAKVPRVSMTLAGDLAQKIYKRSFTWSSVGIDVRGARSKRLNASHRTTKEIMAVARRILSTNAISIDPDYSPPVEPTKSGPPVNLVIGANPRAAYDDGYDLIAEQFERLRKKSVAVAVPFSRQCWPAMKALEQRRTKAKAAKGASLGTSEGGVVVTTFHQLKGLEFDHVVIMGLHDAQFPGRFLAGLDEDDAREEEQVLARLLYMAMTRAKESLTIVGSDPFCRFLEDWVAEQRGGLNGLSRATY